MKDDRTYLLHIRDAIMRILSYTAEGREAFMAETKTQDAVIRNFEVIGEAAKNRGWPPKRGIYADALPRAADATNLISQQAAAKQMPDPAAAGNNTRSCPAMKPSSPTISSTNWITSKNNKQHMTA